MDRAAHSALARALRDPAAATEPLQPPSTASTADNRQRAPQGGSVAVVGEGDVEAAVKGYTPPSFWNMGMGAGGKSEGEDKDKGWQVSWLDCWSDGTAVSLHFDARCKVAPDRLADRQAGWLAGPHTTSSLHRFHLAFLSSPLYLTPLCLWHLLLWPLHHPGCGRPV